MIIDMDIEALNLNYMRGGFGTGEMMVISAARKTGKSLYYGTIYNTNFCKEILLPMNPEPKYKFSRAKWYEVKSTFETGKWSERIEWCTKHFGPDPQSPDAWSRWYPYAWDTIRFRDAKDYEWYILRWS